MILCPSLSSGPVQNVPGGELDNNRARVGVAIETDHASINCNGWPTQGVSEKNDISAPPTQEVTLQAPPLLTQAEC